MKLTNATLLPDTFDYEPGAVCPRCRTKLSWQEDAAEIYAATGAMPRFMDCEECELRCDIETGAVYQVAHDKSCPCEECHAGDYSDNDQPQPSRA